MAKNRILIVEDDASMRRLMMAHFEKSGLAVEYAVELDALVNDAGRMRHPVQDFGVPVYVPRHVTRPPRVLLSPRTRQRADFTATRLRVAAAIAVTLVIAFGAGAAM